MRVPNPFRVTPSMACLAATFLASSFTPGLTSGSGLGAQIVLVDRGTFSVSVGGEVIGSEEFTIRRAGNRRSATFMANGVVTLTRGGESQELRLILSAQGADGTAGGYELKIVGQDASEIAIRVVDSRFVSNFRSAAGLEEREFRVSTDTRIVEQFVAHHYYFLRNLREGETARVIEPRSRTEMDVVAGPSTDEQLRLGGTLVDSRRVTFRSGEHERIVWFGSQGQVLRVEVPPLGYVAERQDLVG